MNPERYNLVIACLLRALLFLSCTLPCSLAAQFHPGNWLADARGLYTYSRLTSNEQRLYEYGVEGKFHFFPLSRLAIGSRLSTSYLALDGNFFQAYDLRFLIEPQLRYYWNATKWPIFIQAGYAWSRIELGLPLSGSESQTANGSGASVGLGGNFPLAPSVNFEGLFLFRYQEQEDAQNPEIVFFTRSLQGRAALRILLDGEASRPSWWGPGEKPVQASSWFIGGYFKGGLVFNTTNTFAFSVLGGVFPANRFAMGMGIGLERASEEQMGAPGLNSQIEPFLRYYLPLSNSMMAFPTASFKWGRSEELNSFSLEAFRFRTWQVGMGLGLFISEFSALELILNLAGRNVSPNNAAPGRNFDVSFSLSAGLMTFWYK